MKTNTYATFLLAIVLAGTSVATVGAAPGVAAPGVTAPLNGPSSPASPSPSAPSSSVASSSPTPQAIASPSATGTAPSGDSVPTPSPSSVAAPDPEKVKTLGATMGQAGKSSPEAKSQTRRSFSLRALPSVSYQPAGTQGQPLGLDVSGWQPSISWSAVRKAGAQFVYIKSSEGGQAMNPSFSQQYNGATSVGLIRGAYHFALPQLSSGASQAKVMLNSGGGWSADGMTMPPALDIEDNPYSTTNGLNRCYGMSPAALTSWVKDFTTTIAKLTGTPAMIYSSYYFWQTCLGGTTEFSQSNPLWIAAYYASSPWMPGGWSKQAIWQYADDFADQAQTVQATFPGDQNVFNGTLDDLKTLASGVRRPVIGLVPGATVVSGKWAGDGKAYVGWFRNGYWCLEMPGNTRKCFYFGAPGDKPVVGDWDGNGSDGVGIVRNGIWQLSDSIIRPTVDHLQYFGIGSDTPLTGDWDGDGKTAIGIKRGSSFQVTNSQNRWPPVSTVSYFGIGSDTPVVGDWDGDGKTSIGVRRGNTFWLTNNLSKPTVSSVFAFGIASDIPTTGDWNGDGKTDVGIVRGSTWQLSYDTRTLSVDSVRL